MKIQNKIDELEKQTEELKRKQGNCGHKWGDVAFNPYTGKKEVMTGRYEEHGVDRWPITEFVDDRKDRWTRVCKECGKVEHTEKRQEIKQAIKTEPVF